ncbi:putative efflux pump membrane fusion protein [Thalassoglobus neptunius]|uniref:Putative efflux pump membrane fusion protein n=1 Tax=Thalassoglobus neptunius TaxID=1938619 RepID=A0A5C5WDQ2_9PLAN|nr:HlyD family efflux transporter periplasmic adaptor subunit [Thalassoglobus neptunius]TWT48221.1 putative efflux pump membrane fusion protein [Thalassoglobus neptunius]
MTHHIAPTASMQKLWILVVSFQFVIPANGIFAADPPANPIVARNCFVRVYEEADIPALERGAITEVFCEIGDHVDAGTVLAKLDDSEAAIAVSLSELELAISKQRHTQSLAEEIANAKILETEQVIAQSQTKQRIAQENANSTVAVEKAIKSRDTAQVELNRALAARDRFSGSVSDSELDRLKYLRDQSELEIIAAREAQTIAALQIQVEEASVGTASATLKRLEHELRLAKSEHRIEELEIDKLVQQVKLAQIRQQRRMLTAPFSGVLTEQYHRLGEWLEPGEPVFHVMRLDRLLVEGYVDANLIHHSMRGIPAAVTFNENGSSHTVRGTLNYVSPKVDPVNQQVQIQVIVDNTDGRMRPGQSVEITLAPEASAEK